MLARACCVALVGGENTRDYQDRVRGEGWVGVKELCLSKRRQARLEASRTKCVDHKARRPGRRVYQPLLIGRIFCLARRRLYRGARRALRFSGKDLGKGRWRWGVCVVGGECEGRGKGWGMLAL